MTRSQQAKAIVTLSRATMMVLALVMSTGSGCAQLKALKAQNADLRVDKARLETDVAHRNAENKRLEGDLTHERARADAATEQLVTAKTDLAKAQGEAAAERTRADALAQQMLYTQRLIDRLLIALEKAWARKRGFIDALVRLKQAGLEMKLSVDACNECAGTGAGAGAE